MQIMGRYDDDTHAGRPFPRPGREGRLDPNYRGGFYRGGRMETRRPWQAEYGEYRLRHADSLGGYGGYDGRYEQTGRGYDRGYQEPRPSRSRYDRMFEGRRRDLPPR